MHMQLVCYCLLQISIQNILFTINKSVGTKRECFFQYVATHSATVNIHSLFRLFVSGATSGHLHYWEMQDCSFY